MTRGHGKGGREGGWDSPAASKSQIHLGWLAIHLDIDFSQGFWLPAHCPRWEFCRWERLFFRVFHCSRNRLKHLSISFPSRNYRLRISSSLGKPGKDPPWNCLHSWSGISLGKDLSSNCSICASGRHNSSLALAVVFPFLLHFSPAWEENSAISGPDVHLIQDWDAQSPQIQCPP